MARSKVFSLTGILVQFFGLLLMSEAFVWVVETKILHSKIRIPELHYAVLIVGVLLFIRIAYMAVKFVGLRKNVVPQTTATRTFANESNQSCAMCGKIVSEKVKAYCLEHSNKFHGKIYCYEHQKNVRG